jgi:hypothetical protein
MEPPVEQFLAFDADLFTAGSVHLQNFSIPVKHKVTDRSKIKKPVVLFLRQFQISASPRGNLFPCNRL